jgi:hypothetical protein
MEPISLEYLMFVEDQAFLRLYDSAPRPVPSAICLSFSDFPCVAWVELTDDGGGGGGRGGARKQIKQTRESLAFYKSNQDFSPWVSKSTRCASTYIGRNYCKRAVMLGSRACFM